MSLSAKLFPTLAGPAAYSHADLTLAWKKKKNAPGEGVLTSRLLPPIAATAGLPQGPCSLKSHIREGPV